MSNRLKVPHQTTLLVRDCCLCLHVQRAARALARHFDEALRPLNLTNGQFSLLMSLNRPQPPPMAAVASLLVMDRTTLRRPCSFWSDCISILRGLAQCAKNQGVVVTSVLKKFSMRFETFSLPRGFEGWHPSLMLSTHAQVSPSLRPISPLVQI